MLPAGRTLRARPFAPVHLAPLGCIYDIQRAVADKAMVPIYYESRIAKLGLNASELPKLDAEFEEITEGEEHGKAEVGMKKEEVQAGSSHPSFFCLNTFAVAHFEKRTEAMVVCVSRRI
ncbi:MAG: hypothetical protein KDK99_06340 [Verrucomicrobiales bacterium]|nr:hypothetical protein [Verrucomicrobiales bacterium]